LSANITPNDILQKKFAQVVRGLRPEEVYDFLSQVASEFEKLLRKNVELANRVKELEEATEEYRNMEATLRNTLVSSQRIGEEIKEEAERKGDVIIKEAELEAERIIQKSKQRKERLEEETFQLLNQHKRFRAEFVSLIETHGKMIRAQDSRIMLEYGLKDPETEPLSEPEIDPNEDAEPSSAEFDEQDPKEMEILFPEDKEK
jgi:cell division initiation protein